MRSPARRRTWLGTGAVVAAAGAVAGAALTSSASGAPAAEAAVGPTGTLAVSKAISACACTRSIAVLRLSPSSRRVVGRRRGAVDMMPSWSEDGRRIAFMRTTAPHASGQIWVMDADGDRARRLTSGNLAQEPAWSPDGASIAHSSARAGRRIKLVRPSNGEARAIPGTRSGLAPAWSADGRLLAFHHGGEGRARVVVIRPDGSGRRTLGPGSQPSWSPDGRRIAFVAGAGQRRRIAIMDADGGNRRRLTRRGSQENPAWSPDGKWIAFDGIRSDDSDSTYVVEVDTGRVVRVARNAHGPSWRP